MRPTTASQSLILNIAPLQIHGKWFKVGKLPFRTREAYRKLRDDNWQTHAFRYDGRVDLIFPKGRPGSAGLGWRGLVWLDLVGIGAAGTVA